MDVINRPPAAAFLYVTLHHATTNAHYLELMHLELVMAALLSAPFTGQFVIYILLGHGVCKNMTALLTARSSYPNNHTAKAFSPCFAGLTKPS
jgi:hypothetical protein